MARMASRCAESLFENAKNGGIQFVYSLVRVKGIESFEQDELSRQMEKVKKYKSKILKCNEKSEIIEILIEIYKQKEIFRIIANLINCSQKNFYQYEPFLTDNIYVYIMAKFQDYESINKYVSYKLKKIFCIDPLCDYSELDTFDLKNKLVSLINFLFTFNSFYKSKLKYFIKAEKICKLPSDFGVFGVLELLCNQRGLYGFKIHYSNGFCTIFRRTKNSTLSLNLSFDNNHVSLFMGNIDKLKHQWAINGWPLYKVGVRGRYNKIGEWKPLIYAGESELIRKKARAMSKHKVDDRIYGCLFYVMATCHHIIEFVVISNFDLPKEYYYIKSGLGNINIHKINIQQNNNYSLTLKAYDCTLELPNIEVDTIESALQLIETFLSRISFRIDGWYKWQIKYPQMSHAPGTIIVKEKDIKLLSEFLVGLKGKDSLIFDTAISWFTNGNQSKNIFHKFLSYYIALEGLAMPFISGELDVSKKYEIKKNNNDDCRKCIELFYKKYYTQDPIDPIKFIKKSYFNCIVGLTKKTRMALEKIFGINHEHIKLFFDKKEGYSLCDLRSQLAHGNFNLIDMEHVDLIRKRLYDLKMISEEFILRVSLGIQPNEKYEKINKSFTLGFSTTDPRSTGVASTLDVFPNKDWKIRLDWLLD